MPASETSAQSGHGHRDGGHATLSTSAHATAHCLAGCMIGETAGLAIGATFGLGVLATLLTATGLAYVTGFALALIPVMKRAGLSFTEAFGVVWLGEAVSIAAMEVAMNAADYLAGGLTATSLADMRFWIGLIAAAPAGFLAAWPVNHWLLKRRIKAH